MIPIHWFPTINAALNGLAMILLIVGYVLIKQGRETAHKRVMISAFGTSVVFLASYLTYHTLRMQAEGVGHTAFAGTGAIRYVYYTILISHVILAAVVPVLAIITMYFGWRAMREKDPLDYRRKHRRIAWWTFPIWLYVSITGVIVYLMLYHLYPSGGH